MLEGSGATRLGFAVSDVADLGREAGFLVFLTFAELGPKNKYNKSGFENTASIQRLPQFLAFTA